MPGMAIGDDEKKKLVVLGVLLLAIMVVVMVLYNPFGGGSTEEDTSGTTTTAQAPENPAGAPAGQPGGTPDGAATQTTATAAPGAITAASLVSLSDYRSDPFEPFMLPSPPPLPPPVEIPAPVEIMPPQTGGYPIPPMGIGTAGSQALTNLPPIVPRRVATAPTAPRVAVMPGGDMGTGSGVLRSPNKRLSGVVIGDSVRALLEVTIGDKVTTRVVQPGDEVDGIRVLRLERVVEAGQTVTRLVIRENNQEQFVELRPAPQQQQQGGIDALVPGGLPF